MVVWWESIREAEWISHYRSLSWGERTRWWGQLLKAPPKRSWALRNEQDFSRHRRRRVEGIPGWGDPGQWGRHEMPKNLCVYLVLLGICLYFLNRQWRNSFFWTHLFITKLFFKCFLELWVYDEPFCQYKRGKRSPYTAHTLLSLCYPWGSSQTCFKDHHGQRIGALLQTLTTIIVYIIQFYYLLWLTPSLLWLSWTVIYILKYYLVLHF